MTETDLINGFIQGAPFPVLAVVIYFGVKIQVTLKDLQRRIKILEDKK
jgi:hypothetical protein